MLWIVTFLCWIVFAAFLFFFIFDSTTYHGIIWKYVIPASISFVIAVSGSLVLYNINSSYYEETVETGIYELISIQDTSQISGKGSGTLYTVYLSIDTNEVYTFYYQVDGNGFKRGTVSANNAVIFEQDDCTSHIIEYTTYEKNKITDTWNDTWREILIGIKLDSSPEKNYEIYVPKGTIVRDFVLDSQ